MVTTSEERVEAKVDDPNKTLVVGIPCEVVATAPDAVMVAAADVVELVTTLVVPEPEGVKETVDVAWELVEADAELEIAVVLEEISVVVPVTVEPVSDDTVVEGPVVVAVATVEVITLAEVEPKHPATSKTHKPVNWSQESIVHATLSLQTSAIAAALFSHVPHPNAGSHVFT